MATQRTIIKRMWKDLSALNKQIQDLQAEYGGLEDQLLTELSYHTEADDPNKVEINYDSPCDKSPVGHCVYDPTTKFVARCSLYCPKICYYCNESGESE